MGFSISIRILVRAARQFAADGVSQMGAALAYYALFSTAPLLILAVLLASFLFGEENARARVREHLTEVVGPASAREVSALMEKGLQPTTGGWVAAGGTAALVLGALGAFLHVRHCLCVIWRLEPPDGSGVLGTLLNYVLAVVMVLCVALLLLVSLAASTAVPVLVRLLGNELPGGAAFWPWVEAGFSFILLSLFIALVFRIMSDRRIAWSHVVYGSLVSALLLTAGNTVIGLYLVYTSTASAYGAAGSLVAFLVWMYYAAQIFFFGAELVQAGRTRAEWLPQSAPAEAAGEGK
jgi:membrane protein